MNTQENNKLIAEFMGARPIVFSDGTKGHTFWNDDFDGEGRYGAFPDGATNYFDYDKGYHKYWDWLMPVVDKIEDVSEGFKWVEVEWISYTFQIENKSVTIWKHSDRFDSKRIIEINGNTKREATYKAVVEFINQYNKNK